MPYGHPTLTGVQKLSKSSFALCFQDRPTPPGQPRVLTAELRTQLLVVIRKGSGWAAVVIPKSEWPDEVRCFLDEQGEWKTEPSDGDLEQIEVEETECDE